MPTPTPPPITSADMRQSAYAAPTAAAERRELQEAEKLRERERIAGLGHSAEIVLELERKLATVENDRRRAAMQARSATAKLEQLHQTLSTVLGKDTRGMRLVETAAALSHFRRELTRLADHVAQADDLPSLKRIVANMDIKQPSTLAEQAQMLGLSLRESA